MIRAAFARSCLEQENLIFKKRSGGGALVNHELRSKSVSTKVSEAELRVLESRAALAGLALSEWVRDVLLGSSVDAGAMAAERSILAEMLVMRAILLNFMLKLSQRQPITEQVSRELIE